MTRDLQDAVVVISGASSGIGRATAQAFASAGARLVLASRNQEALESVASACDGTGLASLVVPTDVGDERAMQRLAERAFDRFGRIDVWVNNAGVGLYGRLEDVPMADFRRLIETNLFGCVNGARAVLPYFRRQDSGTIINVASAAGLAPQPFSSAYVASKAGVRAISGSLRQELLLEHAHIDVCTVLPAAVDTPFFQHAANYTGRKVIAPAPVYLPEHVAETIVDLARTPRREVFVGSTGLVMALRQTVTPGRSERRAAKRVDRRHLSRQRQPPQSGNLFDPMPGAIHGGWRRPRGVRMAAALAASLPIALGLYMRGHDRAGHRAPPAKPATA
jgi:short-subunit dehydrogenase